jgi:hypothetical protein
VTATPNHLGEGESTLHDERDQAARKRSRVEDT